MSDEQHEQRNELTSSSRYDPDGKRIDLSETTRPVCGTCYRQTLTAEGYTAYVRADWPCKIVQLTDERDALAASLGNIHDPCVIDAFMAAGEIVQLREERAVLRDQVLRLTAAANHAITSLADLACVHGPPFDSNEYPHWDNHCSICAAMRGLVLAAAREEVPA